MRSCKQRRHRFLVSGGACLLALFVLIGVGQAQASGPPIAGELWASQVDSRSATLSAEVDPNGFLTGGYFEYQPKATYESKGFSGAKRVSINVIGTEEGMIPVNFPTITALASDTVYLYRLVLTNNHAQQTTKPTSAPYPFFHTAQASGGPLLPDGRGWEMVSPFDKNGGGISPPESIAKGGEMQAAAQGSLVTYSSSSSFAGGQGAPPASQYVSTRTASGWTTQNITVPIFSASYDITEGGSPYRLFSTDLARGLLLNGKGCRGEAEGCPVPNPALPGTDAPAGYQDYYLRSTASGGFEALLGPTETSLSGQSASQFEVSLAGASEDLTHVVLESCAKLSAAAVSGCSSEANLYEWSTGGGALKLLNASPGASLAAQGANAISSDGNRVYLYEGGNLFLRDGSTLKQADAGAGAGGSFQLASKDGSIAYFTKGGDLYRYDAAANTDTKITSTADVVGVLGAASNGSSLYYLRATGLYRCAAANTATASGCDAPTKIADGADASDYPPATGTSRVSSDGTKLLFESTTPLKDHVANTYDNTDLIAGEPDTELYLYDTATGLACVSCNPTNGRPVGPSSIPGAIRNGAGPTATIAYRPRVLTDSGKRIFFTSADAIAPSDTNTKGSSGKGVTDAYEWEAQGEGSCTRPEGCAYLLSSGRDATPSLFADASEDGKDAFFLTGASLVGSDPGAVDLYDARVGGGFGEPSPPIPCEGDSCQALPPEPTEPTLTTLLSGPGNPPVHYTRYGFKATKSCPKGKAPKTVTTKSGKKVKICVAKKVKKPKRHHRRHGDRR
jgi:hypothetical protein